MENKESSDFSRDVQEAIRILDEADRSLTDQQLMHLFYSQGIEYPSSVQISVFLPIAFCRLLLPNFIWLDEYCEFEKSDKEGLLKTFSDTMQYQVIFEIAKHYFSTGPSSEIILKIAGRSSEFKAINDLMLKGYQLEDIKLTPMCIIW